MDLIYKNEITTSDLELGRMISSPPDATIIQPQNFFVWDIDGRPWLMSVHQTTGDCWHIGYNCPRFMIYHQVCAGYTLYFFREREHGLIHVHIDSRILSCLYYKQVDAYQQMYLIFKRRINDEDLTRGMILPQPEIASSRSKTF